MNCGTVFRVLIKGKVKALDDSTRSAADSAATSAPELSGKRHDLRPCPFCGVFQPEMIGWRKAGIHSVLTIPAAIITAVLIFQITARYWRPEYSFLPIPAVVTVASGLCAILLLLQCIIALWIPVVNPMRKRSRTTKMMETGSMKIDIMGAGDKPGVHESVKRMQAKGLALTDICLYRKR